jgi:LPXTG-motif cell wall-anchored protein
LGTGAHTLVVTVGDEAASLGFRIVGNSIGMTLPTTGHNHDVILFWSLALLVAGALVVAVDRRRYRLTR